MSDNYYGYWDPISGCTDDQTGYWDNFKNRYASRNTANWISLIIDGKQQEFFDLLSYANNLSINKLWLFIGNEDTDCGDGEQLTLNSFNNYLSKFLSYAYSLGWLKSISHLYRYEYRCMLPDPCTRCDQEDVNREGWVLVKITDMGKEKED